MPDHAVYEALENVQDQTTFFHFIETLIADRKLANSEEAERPDLYRWNGAREWQSSGISGCLDSALHCLVDIEGRPDELYSLSWRGFAEFLYGGKIYE
jgi:hypothetical protein